MFLKFGYSLWISAHVFVSAHVSVISSWAAPRLPLSLRRPLWHFFIYSVLTSLSVFSVLSQLVSFLSSPLLSIFFSFHHVLLSVFHSHHHSVFNLTLPCTLWFPSWKLKELLHFPSPLLFCTVCLSSVCIFSPLQFSTSTFIFCIIGKPICSALYLNIVLDPCLCFSPGTTGAELITTSKAAISQ